LPNNQLQLKNDLLHSALPTILLATRHCLLDKLWVFCAALCQFCMYVRTQVSSWKKEGKLGDSSVLPDRESGLAPGLSSHKGFTVLVL
jgi:hypothetical protein